MSAGLPYDAEVEYLESTGTQWIDLGFKGTNLFTCDIGLNRATTTSYWAFGYTQNWSGGGYVNSCGGFLESNGWMYLFVVDGNGMSWSNASITNTPRAGDIQLLITRNNTTGSVTRTIKAEGLAFTKTNTAQAFATDRNLCLFKLGGESAPLASSSGMRLKYCKINDGDNEVDFIPVRVGSGSSAVGYMYDRVTKRLFGNQGTGSFIIGPDVARPVMGIKRYQDFTARSYVQDGLVAMWDGIENAGWGQSDDNNLRWKELITGTDCNIYNIALAPAPTRLKDGYAFDNTRDKGFVTPIISGISHIDIVYKLNYNQSSCAAQFSGGTDVKVVFVDTGSETAIGLSYDGKTSAKAGNIGAKHSVSIERAHGWTDGVETTYTANVKTGWGFNYTSGYGMIAVNKTENFETTFQFFDGDIYAIRCYSRALTAAEIAYNYSIDKLRFNLP